MNIEKNIKLPKNWLLTTIGEIGIIVSGGTPSTQNKNYWGEEIPWITPSDLSKYTKKYISHGNRNISKEGLNNSSAKLLPKGTILFSSRAPIGYTVIAQNELTTNQGFKNLITTESLLNEYVYYYFKTLKPLAEEVASGTTFLELSSQKFSKLPFPLPPFDEQVEIVAKINELFSTLDCVDNYLIDLRNKLLTYRHSILSDKFKGKWKHQKWENILNIKNGKHYKGIENEKGKYPIYGSAGIINYTDQYLCNENSIIIGRKGTINKPLYIKEKFWNIDTAFGIEVNQKILNPKFFYYFTLTYNFLELNQSSTIPSLTKSKLLKIDMPVPDLKTQNNIVIEIEKSFSIIDNIDKVIINSINKANTLRYSILNNAFTGNLIKDHSSKNAKDLYINIQKEKNKYMEEKKELEKNKIKTRKTMNNELSILELLAEQSKQILVNDLWQQSIYKDDVEKFYSELKRIEKNIIIEKINKSSFIRIKNAN